MKILVDLTPQNANFVISKLSYSMQLVLATNQASDHQPSRTTSIPFPPLQLSTTSNPSQNPIFIPHSSKWPNPIPRKNTNHHKSHKKPIKKITHFQINKKNQNTNNKLDPSRIFIKFEKMHSPCLLIWILEIDIYLIFDFCHLMSTFYAKQKSRYIDISFYIT